ncbi:retrovirus-related pol polyprotein from transposon TNT 1-94 [Tanacetum coccineum]
MRCGDPNHLIGECPKPPKDKNQRAFVGGSWSDSGEEDDEKVKDETCLVAQASSEVCSESSYFSDENSSIDDLVLDNEYDKLCKMSLKIITKNKRLKATRNSLEKELSILKEKVSTLEKNKGVDLECVKCHMLKIENEKLKEEAIRLTKFEKSTHCLNEMLSNQKPSEEKLGLGFNSFEASSSGTKEIKFVKAHKKASSDGGPINMGAPHIVQADPKEIMGPPVITSRSEKSVSFQKSILGHRPKHIMVNNIKFLVASDKEVKRFYKPSLKPGVGFSKPNFRSKTPPPKRVNNNYPRPKTPQPKRKVGRQNQPHGFPICLRVDLEPDKWIKDSGCSKHMTGNRKLFSSYKAYNRGNVIFGCNLRGQICNNKCRVTFSEHDSEITKDGKEIRSRQYASHSSLASKELVRNLPKLKFDQHFCDACKIRKQVHTSHKAKNIVSTPRCLELFHMDLFGPSAVRSYGGNRYTLVIVDDYSRYTWTRFLKDKTEAFDQFKIFSNKIQNQLGCTIVSIRTDHGREFDNEVQFKEFCNANGITHNFSAPRTPQSNDVVERKNRTLQEMSRTMLNEQSLPQKFWCNALDTSTYILNRILIRAILGKTPYELLRGRKPTLDYFRVFRSKCFILNTKDYLTKFDLKSYKGVFLGYSQNSKAYIILNKHTRKIKESLNVTFDETPLPSKTSPLVDDDLDEEEAIKGACVFTDKWSLDELAYGVPRDGLYQTNPPSPEDIISYIRNDREDLVTCTRHRQKIDVQDYQILTREIVSTLKPLQEIIQENVFCLGGNRDHVPACLCYMLYCIARSEKFNLAYYMAKRMEWVIKQARLILPYGMLLTRLFKFVMSESPELVNESYVLYDRVMNPLTAQQEQKTIKDCGTRRCHHSTSSSSAFDQPSSTHLNHDDDDGNNEGTSREDVLDDSW